jgi:hypothetical protein
MKVSCVTDSGLITIDLDEVSFIEISPHDKYFDGSVFIRVFISGNAWSISMHMDEAIRLMNAYATKEEMEIVLENLIQWRIDSA